MALCVFLPPVKFHKNSKPLGLDILNWNFQWNSKGIFEAFFQASCELTTWLEPRIWVGKPLGN